MKKGLFCLLFLCITVVSLQAQQDTTYKSFLGTYYFSAGSVIPSIEVAGDSLKAMSMTSEAGSSPLEYVGNDKFTITNFNGTAEFKRTDSTKQVNAVHIEAMGYILDGTKANGTIGWTWSLYITNEHLYAVMKK